MISDALKWKAIRAANAAVPGGDQPAWTHAYEAAAVRLRMAELGAVGDGIVCLDITPDLSRFEAALSRAAAPRVRVRPVALGGMAATDLERAIARVGEVFRGR